jgi:multiple sugar transport system ATP-binding protein
MAKVTLQNVSKTYPPDRGADVRAVTDVSLEVADREFVVLVGPSGCGKSTTLRMIAGLDEPSAGDIYIGDKRMNGVPPQARDIAMVFQNHALFPHLNVYDNMAFGLKLRKFGSTEIKKRVQDAAAILGIEELLQRRPNALSGGQQQRVAVGRAIVGQPKVFLFDEPLSNLDATLRVQMRAEITKLHERLQATMIYVTHDQVEAMTMGDRIVVMDAGVVQQIDTPMNLYRSPANMFVAGFLGSPAMNLIHGALKQERDGLVFTEAGEGTVKLRLSVQVPAGDSLRGKAVVLGVRPEHLQIVENPKTSGRPAGESFPAIVDHVEALGPETHLYLDTGAHRVVCRTSGSLDPHEGGRRRHFTLPPERVQLFDPETGASLSEA